jgi:predicted AlkP superfamily phosphohydrolase/phosphomutase
MKILVVGLDSAAPDLLFGDERLSNFRRLMAAGCYGRLKTIIPPITVPAWMCTATSQDPGSLGVYGFRNRSDHSYGALSIADARSIRELTIWDQVAREGGRANVFGVPPGYPPRKVNGISVGCFLTPDTARDDYTLPPGIKAKIAELVGDYPVDVKGFRTDRKDWLKDEIYGMSRKHFEVVRHYLQKSEWDYFQFVEIGLDRLQHGFWKFHDPGHVLHEPGNPYEEVIRDYYLYLDDELGSLLNLLDEDTAVLVMSDHGSQRLDGGFCVNEWLVKEGLLVLDRYPEKVTPFGRLSVNWDKTRVWSEGGYYARVFLNVKGREPNGTIDAGDYERVRDEIKARLEALPDDTGRPMGTVVYKPDEIYRHVRNVAPDLIVHFGDLYWRSIGGVGYPALHVQENDTGPDDCNHAQHGSFILAAPNSPLTGEQHGVEILSMAPTLLELGGYDIPTSMQGTSLTAGKRLPRAAAPAASLDSDDIVRERLMGLGYIS